MSCRDAHLNTQQGVEAKLDLQHRTRLQKQAHYAVQDKLYHQLTFIMLNLPQTMCRPTRARNAKQPRSAAATARSCV